VTHIAVDGALAVALEAACGASVPLLAHAHPLLTAPVCAAVHAITRATPGAELGRGGGVEALRSAFQFLPCFGGAARGADDLAGIISGAQEEVLSLLARDGT
jgi:hypothetical protein